MKEQNTNRKTTGTAILYTYLLSAVMMAGLHTAAHAQTSYIDRISFTVGEMTICKDSTDGSRYARMEMLLTWKDHGWVHPQHTLKLVPALISSDSASCFEFTPIYIDGRIRGKAVERENRLKPSKTGQRDSAVVLEVGRKAPHEYRYVCEIPYSPEMLDGRLEIREEITGCAGCGEGRDTVPIAPVLPEYIPEWKGMEFMKSPHEDNKDRERTHTAKLEFPVNRWSIMPDYRNNATALAEMETAIREAMNDTLFTIGAVKVIGYASPDGPLKFNTVLAKKRAESLAVYLERNIEDIPDTLISAEGRGEDWEGFRMAIAADPALETHPILTDVLSKYNGDNADSCERAIKRDAALYSILREGILKDLRRIDYVIEYSLKDFTTEEARLLWQEHPEYLSIREFNAVAESYGKGTPEYLKVIFAAAHAFPADAACVHNAAIALADAGMTREALSILSGKNEPELLNTTGIILAGNGDYVLARTCFERAAAMGERNAEANIRELERVMEQL